jgi:hypothetical protein
MKDLENPLGLPKPSSKDLLEKPEKPENPLGLPKPSSKDLLEKPEKPENPLGLPEFMNKYLNLSNDNKNKEIIKILNLIKEKNKNNKKVIKICEKFIKKMKNHTIFMKKIKSSN